MLYTSNSNPKQHAVKDQQVKPISVRLSAEQQERLAELSSRLGSNQAMLIRWGVEALLDYVDANDGSLTLPLSYATDSATKSGGKE